MIDALNILINQLNVILISKIVIKQKQCLGKQQALDADPKAI